MADSYRSGIFRARMTGEDTLLVVAIIVIIWLLCRRGEGLVSASAYATARSDLAAAQTQLATATAANTAAQSALAAAQSAFNMAQAGLAVQQKLLAQTQAAFGSKPIGVTPIRLATAAVATAQAAVASASTTLSAKQLAASIAAATLKTVTAQTGPVISASNAIMNQYDTEAAAAMAAAATAAAAKFDSAYNRVISLKKNLGLSGQTICAKQLGSNYSGVVSNACSNLKNAQFDLTWARTNAALDPGRRAKPDP